MSFWGLGTQVPSVSPGDARRELDDGRAVLVDVGRPREWLHTGHLPDAVLLSIDNDLPYEQLAHGGSVIVGCRNDQRGIELVADLRRHGVDAMLLAGGPWAWEHAGYPMMTFVGSNQTVARNE